MRISALQSDRSYESYFLLRKAEKAFAIRLFGADLYDVLTADEEEGFVVKCIRDPGTGKCVVDKATGRQAQIRLRGPVQIVVK
jgi:hypothetical protein